MNDKSKRVDYDTARLLMLMGFPQHIPNKNPLIRQVRIGQPHYVTIYNANRIHEYVEELNIGHVHCADVMCYAPTKTEALEWIAEQIRYTDWQKQILALCKKYRFVKVEFGPVWFCVSSPEDEEYFPNDNYDISDVEKWLSENAKLKCKEVRNELC